MSVPDYKINYKSDFVLTINGDAGWAIPFCIKFWTGMPSQAYFVGFDGVKYVNCKVGDTPTQLLVMFDDHHLPIGKLEMQIAYHTTIEEFPGSVFDEVTNARDVIVTIDGTDYQVMLDFTGEDAPELEFDLPAYANEAERIQNELQRQQNEADRIAAELQREQVTAAAVAGAENVNAQLSGTTLTVTNRQGVSTSVNTKGEQGEQGPVGPEGPQGEQGISIVDFRPVYASETATYYVITFSDGHEQSVAIPKGAKGDTGATGPTGPQGPQGQTGVSITGMVKTGETETDTLYNITFSNGTTQAVAIPKGEKGDQGPAGPQGPQGPMGDVAVITPEQQAAFTMYSVPGNHTDGPMTQKAVTDSLVSETISYDNSESGIAAENVQGAIDEVTSLIPREIHSTWVQGGIKTADGTDSVTQSRIRSEYIAVKDGDIIHVNPKTHYVAIYLYNTDKTSALGAYAYLLANGGVEYDYICPQDGFVRFIESKVTDTSQKIEDYEQIADIMIIPDSVYVLKSEMKEKADRDEIASEVNLNEIAQGVGYPELSSGKWRTNIIGGTNRYHKVLERKSGMDLIKIDSDTSKTARYFFLTAYPNALASGSNDSVYTVDFCSGHSTVYSIPQDSSSGWVEIPSDCKYIVIIELNNAVNYLPKSVYVVKDVEDEVIGYQLPFFCFWQGGMDNADGADNTSLARIKTGFLPVKQGDKIHIDYNNQHVSIREFNSSKTQINNTIWYAKQEYECIGDGYVRFIVANKAASLADLTPSALTASITFPISIDNRITNADWRSKGGFVVGSWNIGHFSHGAQTDSTITASTYETMKAAYKKAVEYMDADLVSLSEYSPIFYGSETAREALFNDMSWGHVGVQRQYACQAVYAGHKIDNVNDVNITSVTTTHYYTAITFEHFGKIIKFVSVHIQAGADIPAQFTELINAFANDEYVIITGDFNVTNMSDLSAFTNAGYTLANGGAWGNIETFTHTKTSDGYCLDNIVAKGFYMTDVKTFPFELSDHYPFVCRLMLKQN